MRHCEFGTVLNKLIHGDPQGKSDDAPMHNSEVKRVQGIMDGRQRSRLQVPLSPQ